MGVLDVTVGLAAGAYAGDGKLIYGLRTDPERFSWTSSNPGVVNVDGHGAVTSLSEGSATITAEVEGIRGSTLVTVHDRATIDWSVPVGSGTILGGVAINPEGNLIVGVSTPASARTRWIAITPGGAELWVRDLPITGRSMPAFGEDGSVYLTSMSTGGTGAQLLALNPDGTDRWGVEDLDDIRSSPVVGPAGGIYVAGGRHVHAFHADGLLRWTFDAGHRVFAHSAPAISSDGTLYVGGMDGRVWALEKTGLLEWTVETGDVIQSSPSIASDGTIYVGSMDGRLYAIHPGGHILWSVLVDARGVASSPAIGSNGTVYVGGGGVVAIDPGGTIRWSFSGSQVTSTPVLGANGNVYVAAAGGITALDSDGRLLWDHPLNGLTAASPAIGLDGRILVPSFSGSASRDAFVHAITEVSPNGGYAASPWPTERGNRLNSGKAGG